MKIKLTLIAMLIATFNFAQKSPFDLTFGTNGGTATGFELGDIGKKVAVQPDGKILALGINKDSTFTTGVGFIVIRYNKNGKLDKTFGQNGIAKVDVLADEVNPYKITLGSNGKILIVGTLSEINVSNSKGFLIQLNDNGIKDATFGKNGIVIVNTMPDIEEPIISSAIQKDGKFLVTGYSLGQNLQNLIVERYNVNGVLDTSFAKKGRFELSSDTLSYIGTGIGVQSTGDIVISMIAIDTADNIVGALIRLNPKGKLQTAFGKKGFTLIDEIDSSADILYAIDVQADDKIVVLDNNEDNELIIIRRILPNGNPDLNFGKKSRVELGSDSTYVYASDFAIDKNGNILVPGLIDDGFSQSGLIVKINPDGSIAKDGYVKCDYEKDETEFFTIAIQPDGQLICDGRGFFDADKLSGIFRIDLSKVVPTVELMNDVSSMLLSPNVATEQTKLTFSLNETQAVSVQLIDIQGRIVNTFINNEVLTAGAQQLTLDLPSNLVAGTYFVQLQTAQGSSVVTLIKK